MAVYSKDGLSNANRAIAILDNEVNDTVTLINQLSAFKTKSATELKGKAWDLVRESLDSCIVALNARKESAQLIANTIKTVNNNMLAALGTYSQIDTDNLEEENNTYNKCKEILYGNNSTFTKEEKEYYNSTLMAQAEAMIEQINKVVAAEKQCLSELNSLLDEVSDYQSKTENITSASVLYTVEI